MKILVHVLDVCGLNGIKMYKKIITIEDIDYSQEDIQQMDDVHLKMLISFVENEKDLETISNWTESEIIKSYIYNLIDNIKKWD